MHIYAHGIIPIDPQLNFKTRLYKKVPKNVHLWFYSTIGCQLVNLSRSPQEMMLSEIKTYGSIRGNEWLKLFQFGSLLGEGDSYVDTLLAVSPMHSTNIQELGVYNIQIPPSNSNNNNSIGGSAAPVDIKDLPITKSNKTGRVWLSTILNSPQVTRNASKGPVFIVVNSCRNIVSPGGLENANGYIIRQTEYHRAMNHKTFFSQSQFPPSVINNMQQYIIKMLENEAMQTGAYMKKHGYHF